MQGYCNMVFSAENIRFERMWSIKPNKFQAYRYKPLSQFSFY
jgi:hypothetical protein